MEKQVEVMHHLLFLNLPNDTPKLSEMPNKVSNDGRNPQTGQSSLKAVVDTVVEATKTLLSPGETGPADQQTKTKKKLVAVEFIKSPTGLFNLAYSPGDKAKLPKEQAQELVVAGYAEYLK